jgi:hypothetical protein
MHYYGIHGSSAHWFKTYLTTRKQNQKGEFLSNWEIIESGVTQGTIPEPLLFIMYIQDPPYGINSYAKPVRYSDDTTMLITANNLNDLKTKLYSTLNNMNKWILVNGLSLNIEKTHSVKFSSNHLQNDQFQITYQNKTINTATNIAFLWLELDKYMNWYNHT